MLGPRIAKPTVRFVDDYCELYRFLFPEVRSFEAFKHLHVGMISEIKRKSLPGSDGLWSMAEYQLSFNL